MIQQHSRSYMDEGSVFTSAPFPSRVLPPCPFQLPALSLSHNNPRIFPPVPEQTPLLELENGWIQSALKGGRRDCNLLSGGLLRLISKE